MKQCTYSGKQFSRGSPDPCTSFRSEFPIRTGKRRWSRESDSPGSGVGARSCVQSVSPRNVRARTKFGFVLSAILIFLTSHWASGWAGAQLPRHAVREGSRWGPVARDTERASVRGPGDGTDDVMDLWWGWVRAARVQPCRIRPHRLRIAGTRTEAPTVAFGGYVHVACENTHATDTRNQLSHGRTTGRDTKKRGQYSGEQRVISFLHAAGSFEREQRATCRGRRLNGPGMLEVGRARTGSVLVHFPAEGADDIERVKRVKVVCFVDIADMKRGQILQDRRQRRQCWEKTLTCL